MKNFGIVIIVAVCMELCVWGGVVKAQEVRKVALLEDPRSNPPEGLKSFLEKRGFRISFIQGLRWKWVFRRYRGMKVETLQQRAVILRKELDPFEMVIFDGGWSMYFWLGGWNEVEARLALCDYVARGGAVLFTGFRTGPVRNPTRQAFPEIARAYTKVNSRWLVVENTNHFITKGLQGEINHTAPDHLVLKVGPRGKVLALDSANRPILVIGKYGRGRVCFSGLDFGVNDEWKAQEQKGESGRLFGRLVEWLTAGGKYDLTESDKLLEQSLKKVLRQECIWNKTDDGTEQIDYRVGNLVGKHIDIRGRIDALREKLDFYGDWCDPPAREALPKDVNRISEEVNRRYEELRARRIEEIRKLDYEELLRTWEDTVKNIKRWESAFPEERQIGDLERRVNTLVERARARRRAYLERKNSEEIKRDEGSVQELMAQLNSDDESVRAKACIDLGTLGNQRAVGKLISMLDDENHEVRRNAIYALLWMRRWRRLMSFAGELWMLKGIDGPGVGRPRLSE